MMEPYQVQLSPQANMALSTLPAAERDQIWGAIMRLHPGLPGSGAQHIQSVKGQRDGSPVYVLTVEDRFRVVFEIEPDQRITVLDVINQGLVKYFRAAR